MQYTGTLHDDGGREYRAENHLTGDTYTANGDPGPALQWLHDTLLEDGSVLIWVSPGFYRFESTVQFIAKGMVLDGPNHWQQNRFSPVQFRGEEGVAGEPILQFGDEEARGGEHSRVSGIYIKCAEADKGIYGRSAGTLHLEHVKSEAVPEGGHGIHIEGGSNCSLAHVYADNLAVTHSPVSGDDTNSLNMDTVILNSSYPTGPAFLADGDGWDLSNVYVNSFDGADLTVPLMTSPDDGKLHRIRWTGGFLGGNAPILLDGPAKVTLAGLRIMGGRVGITDPREVTIVNCRFEEIPRPVEAMVGTGRNVIASSTFRDCGPGEGGLIHISQNADSSILGRDRAGNGFWNWALGSLTFLRSDADADLYVDAAKTSGVYSGCTFSAGVVNNYGSRNKNDWADSNRGVSPNP